MMQRGLSVQAAHRCPPCFPCHLVLSLPSVHCLPLSCPLRLTLSHLCGRNAVHGAHIAPIPDVQMHHWRGHGQQPQKKYAQQVRDLVPFCETSAWQQRGVCLASWQVVVATHRWNHPSLQKLIWADLQMSAVACSTQRGSQLPT